MKTVFNKEFWNMGNLRQTWEYKSIAFILRGIVALMVVVYLLLTLPAIWPWMQKTYARLQPPEKFEELVTTATQTGDFTWTHQWLSARPRTESAQHAAVIEKHLGDVPPAFLTFLMQYSESTGDAQNTRFWMALTRYRTRFDLLRCGIPDAVEEFDRIQSALFAFHLQKDYLADTAKNPTDMANLLQRVLDHDAQHPARNSPMFTCQMAQKLFVRQAGQPLEPAPPEAWQTIRHTLRLVTEKAIADMRAQAAGTTP